MEDNNKEINSAMTICSCCGGTGYWLWEEAFEKFGFNDGDGYIETFTVKDILTESGYEVETVEWGMHNTIINSIRKDGKELIPESCTIGYDNPRDYLPEEIILLLDKELPAPR